MDEAQTRVACIEFTRIMPDMIQERRCIFILMLQRDKHVVQTCTQFFHKKPNLHLHEWPFIVDILRHTCVLITVSNQHRGTPASWDGLFQQNNDNGDVEKVPFKKREQKQVSHFECKMQKKKVQSS